MSFINKFTKKDLGFAVLTGLITGLIFWRVFEFLGASLVYGISWGALVVIIPILWILGVLLGYLLGGWMQFFNQFGKFVAIGFTNAAVTFGTLNLLISKTGYTDGGGYAFISGVGFIFGLLSSYVWIKYWAFDAGRSGGGKAEFFKFVSVSLVALLFNVVTSSVVVNLIHPVLGLDLKQWANIGAIAGSAVGLIFSFVGFRTAVFK
ncbi:MAG: GtrA family protein [Patescibacteria group bacterium]